jgi:hypothetical protein
VSSMSLRSALALFLAGHSLAPSGAVAPPRAATERHRVVEGVELVALTGGRLLARSDRGLAYLRSPEGTWTDGLQLPLSHVWALTPDGEGFLASGLTARDTKAVVLFDANARELRRWEPSEPGWELLVVGSRRWYVEPAGMVELLSDGKLGDLERFSERPGTRVRQARVLAYEGRRLICDGADRSMQYHAKASCRSPGSEAWTTDDPSGLLPVNCGPWVSARGRRDGQVVVFSFTGKALGRRTFSPMPAFACADSDSLVIGAGGVVQVVRLPSLAPLLSHRAAGGKVVTVAAPKGVVAYGTNASSDVFVTAR